MARIARDYAVPPSGVATLHPRENIYSIANLAAVNAEAVIAADGCETLTFLASGTFVATMVVEGSVDGANYITLPILNLNRTTSIVRAASVTTAGSYAVRIGGYRVARIRLSAYTSGSVSINAVASLATLPDIITDLVATTGVSATAAVGVAVTLSLPAPGAGLRQYVTSILVERFATALLTAGSAPVLITSTNYPHTPVASFAADAAPAGSVDRFSIPISVPVAGTAQNTALTIVCPATPLVIWRAHATYLIGP